MIPYGRQDIDQSDIDAVVATLTSDFLTQGPMVPRFEQAVATRMGARHAVTANSATSALHITCLALNLGPGDLLWTVPNTFVASANCARYCGAAVDFVDIDARTWNISVDSLRNKLETARLADRLPKVLVPVHFSGQPTDQEAIWTLAREYGFRVLEDASHSIGASRNGEPVGSCRWSDITIVSFHPVKIITTGEGGMALTNDADLAARMAMLRSHGITREPARFRAPLTAPNETYPSWYYEQQALGFNYRMTDIHAALGLSQLARLEQRVESRNALARRYDAALEGLPLDLPHVLPGNRSAFHLYVIRVPSTSERTRRDVYDQLRARGIGVNLHLHAGPPAAVLSRPRLRARIVPARRAARRDGDHPAALQHADRGAADPCHCRREGNLLNVAIIPARGGSKRIPRKNIKTFFGKPMIAWSIEAAKTSALFDHIAVSTDDPDIADVARQWARTCRSFVPRGLPAIMRRFRTSWSTPWNGGSPVSRWSRRSAASARPRRSCEPQIS